MTFLVGLLVLAAMTLLQLSAASGQQLTADQNKRIEFGINLIKLGCGTGSSHEKTEITGSGNISLTLSKPSGITEGGRINYSIEEAQGLATSLQGVITAERIRLSEEQLNCMKPYIEKIFAFIFPDQQTAPASAKSSASMVLLPSETQPLDGYRLTGKAILPAKLDPGIILPGGARTRLVLQATDTTRIVQIDRVSIKVIRHDMTPEFAFNYVVDPLRQPGFGAARPRQFYVRLEDTGKAQIFYISEQQKSIPVPLDNILPKKEFPILELDSHSGLQEALDFNLVAVQPGFYEVRFVANATSQGVPYDLHTAPIYIIRR
jgi:hypothetical protein